MPRYRTIQQAAACCKASDPETAITEWRLRSLARSGQLPCLMAGKKYLIDLDTLEDDLSKLSCIHPHPGANRIWRV